MSGCKEKSSLAIPAFEEWWVSQTGGVGVYECRGHGSGNQCPDEWQNLGVFDSVDDVVSRIRNSSGGKGCLSVDIRDSSCCGSEVIKPFTVCYGDTGLFIGCGDESMLVGSVAATSGSIRVVLAYYIFSTQSNFLAGWSGDNCVVTSHMTCQVTPSESLFIAGQLSSDNCQGTKYCEMGCGQVSHNPSYGSCGRRLGNVITPNNITEMPVLDHQMEVKGSHQLHFVVAALILLVVLTPIIACLFCRCRRQKKRNTVEDDNERSPKLPAFT